MTLQAMFLDFFREIALGDGPKNSRIRVQFFISRDPGAFRPRLEPIKATKNAILVP